MIYTGCQLSSVAPYLQTGSRCAGHWRRSRRSATRPCSFRARPWIYRTRRSRRRCAKPDWTASRRRRITVRLRGKPAARHRAPVACGCRYLTFALLPREADTPEKLERFAEKVRKIGEMVAGAGLIFAFHPIGPDFRQMEGTPVYERLMALLPPDMQLTFCVHSCLGSGISYAEVLEKFSGRVDLVHFKDSIRGRTASRALMPLGAGSVDWRPVASQCAAAGVRWIFAEQERWQKDAFVCAAESYAYMQGLAHSL